MFGLSKEEKEIAEAERRRQAAELQQIIAKQKSDEISEIMEESPPIVPCSTPGIQVKPFLESSSDCVILTKKGELYGLVTLWDFMNQK